jgi:5-methyltetrahydropteroyltriglutamate--homocysteine methyltransferase
LRPPYRADHVGSLLRPVELARARRQWRAGDLAREPLRDLEDRAIRDAVARQEALGLRSVTDGEFRRDWWHLDFLTQLDGVAIDANPGLKFGGPADQPPIATVVGKLSCSKPIMVGDFEFLASVARATPKMTIPSPSMLHLRGGRNAISTEVYPDLDEFWTDVAAAYRVAIAQLARAGCVYLQLDDVAFAYLCDPRMRDTCRRNGDDPDDLPRRYAAAVDAALAGRPAGMTVTMHTCRGNFKSAWVAEGGYEIVAEAMFSTSVDAFFMEFDSERAGGFEPLRLLPADKTVVLGLVTTKSGELEDADLLRRRIDAAARYVPLERLCLSPQCGFSSTHHGNALSEVEQWRKLELVVEVARSVWGQE